VTARGTTATARLREAAGMTLVVHGVQTGCAVLAVLPLLSQLAPELAHGLHDAPLGHAELTALLEVGARSGHRLLFWALGCLAGHALLTPLLALAWLHALARRESLVQSLARAASGYGRALALGGCALAAWLAISAAAALALQPELAGALPHSASVELALTASCLGALAFAGLLVSTAHDLARARLAFGASAWSALRFALRRLDASLVARHALFAGAIAAVTVAAELLGRPSLPVPGMALLGLQQLLLLGASLLRGAWLAVALIASEPAGPDAPLAHGDLDAQRVA
jgi:hypothetical protein